MSILVRIRQRFCKHHYKKHYSKSEKAYIMRCTKCGATLKREGVKK